MAIRMFFIAASILAISMGTGCASTPYFRPSHPIEQVSSLNEGLLLCNEYHLTAPASRPLELKPFLNCLDQLNQTFDSQGTHLTFQTFHAEILKKYDLLQESEWIPQLGVKYEIAIHAIQRKLAHGGPYDFPYAIFTPREQELVIRFFPKTAQLLGAKKWNVSPQAQFDPELEKLVAEVASLLPSRAENGDESDSLMEVSLPIEPGTSQVQYENKNIKLKKLKHQITQLYELWKDLKIFARMNPEGSLSFTQTLSRYRKLLVDAKTKVKKFKMNEPGDFSYDDSKS